MPVNKVNRQHKNILPELFAENMIRVAVSLRGR